MKKIFLSFFILLATPLVLSGCSIADISNRTTESSEENRFEVAVSVLPYTQILKEIAGDGVSVFSIVPEGYSPETYEPTPQEMKRLATAKFIVFNGDLPYERKIESIILETNPEVKIVKLNEALLEEQFLALSHEHHHEEEHEEEHEDEHTHEENTEFASTRDPHTWLSPQLVVQQMPLVVAALQEIDPEKSEVYAENAEQVTLRLKELSAEITGKLAPHTGKSFLVYHPAYGYYAEEFGVEQHFIEIEGREPSAAQIKESIEAVQQENIGAVFLEKQFATRTAQALASELSVPVVYVNPLDPAYYDSLRFFTNTLLEGF